MINEHTPLFKQRAYIDKAMKEGVYTQEGFIVYGTGELIKVSPKRIAICTGVKDSEGKEIYTGDSLESYSKSMGVGIVRYLVKGGSFVLTGLDGTNVYLSAGYARKCKIKGSVYTSKKALKLLKELIKNNQ